MSEPIVLVLAGGASNRFWPLRDKLLLRFGAASLLQRHLRILHDAGASHWVIVTSPEAEASIRALVTALRLDHARIAVQAEAKGMAHAVLSARADLAAFGEAPLYVTQAHDVFDASLHKHLLHAHGDAFGHMAAVRVESYFPGGYLRLDGHHIREIVEKPGAGNEPSDLVNLVAHAFADWRPLIIALEQAEASGGGDDAYERALTAIMADELFAPMVYEGRWEALKYPWQTLDVMRLLLDRWAAGEESPGEGYKQDEDGIFLGQDVRIYPGSHVVAPALLGHGSIVGHNALVRGSIVGERCVVGFGSEIARSYLDEGVELHHNYVGDSVLGAGASMGYGATTANFRLDGRTVPSIVGSERLDSGRLKLGLILGAGAKLGVNTSTMPGVKIGAAAIVGPNQRVTRDVPDGARVLNDDEYGRL